jgi:uncharacterized membrane protein
LAVRPEGANFGDIGSSHEMDIKLHLTVGMKTTPKDKIPNANIEAITALEKASLESRTSGERVGDAIARHAGRSWFIVLHAIWFVAWVIMNSHISPFPSFDPYPYQFLTFVVSLEAIFLSLFILMSQNRATRQADDRTHLDLQINLLAEQESTKMLQMLSELCDHHGLSKCKDLELEQLTEATKPEQLLKDLRDSLPHNT